MLLAGAPELMEATGAAGFPVPRGNPGFRAEGRGVSAPGAGLSRGPTPVIPNFARGPVGAAGGRTDPVGEAAGLAGPGFVEGAAEAEPAAPNLGPGTLGVAGDPGAAARAIPGALETALEAWILPGRA